MITWDPVLFVPHDPNGPTRIAHLKYAAENCAVRFGATDLQFELGEWYDVEIKPKA
jgi:hypothetical protein